MVNALELWEKIAACPDAVKAVQFYDECGFSKDDVLCRGAANFDVRVTKELKRAAEVIDKEELHYRIAYYANKYKGYMDMHIKQNLAVFEKSLKGIQEDAKSILFVDYGCGPMTSGLALAEILSRSDKTDDYKKYVSYHGIDTSEQVVKYAGRINDKYKVFDPGRFSVAQADDLCLSSVLDRSPQIAILCLSFVLAPGTFRTEKQATEQESARLLAKQWNKFVKGLSECEKTRIIYINPMAVSKSMHANWYPLSSTMKSLSNHEQGMKYRVSAVGPCDWGGSRPCDMATIKGRRQIAERQGFLDAPLSPPPTVPPDQKVKLEAGGGMYVPDFITEKEESDLLKAIDREEWIAELERWVQHYGYRYDYTHRSITHEDRIDPLPDWTDFLCRKLVREGIFGKPPDQLIVNGYEPGQGIAPHADRTCFGPVVAGLSLGGDCLMRLYPSPESKDDAFDVALLRRSLIVFKGDSRKIWRHEIAKRKSDKWEGVLHKRKERVSLTFRTVLLGADAGQPG